MTTITARSFLYAIEFGNTYHSPSPRARARLGSLDGSVGNRLSGGIPPESLNEEDDGGISRRGFLAKRNPLFNPKEDAFSFQS